MDLAVAALNLVWAAAVAVTVLPTKEVLALACLADDDRSLPDTMAVSLAIFPPTTECSAVVKI